MASGPRAGTCLPKMSLFCQFCQKLGWTGKGTHFDVLPIVLSDNGVPKFYEFPENLVLTVPIKHPK